MLQPEKLSRKNSIYDEHWIQSKPKKEEITHFISDNLKCNSFSNLAVIETIYKPNTNMRYIMVGEKPKLSHLYNSTKLNKNTTKM